MELLKQEKNECKSDENECSNENKDQNDWEQEYANGHQQNYLDCSDGYECSDTRDFYDGKNDSVMSNCLQANLKQLETPTKFSTIDNTPEASKSKLTSSKHRRVLDFEGYNCETNQKETDYNEQMTQENKMEARGQKEYKSVWQNCENYTKANFFNTSPEKSA
jgi:hypothetical protein